VFLIHRHHTFIITIIDVISIIITDVISIIIVADVILIIIVTDPMFLPLPPWCK
jgi:hypothetical protein